MKKTTNVKLKAILVIASLSTISMTTSAQAHFDESYLLPMLAYYHYAIDDHHGSHHPRRSTHHRPVKKHHGHHKHHDYDRHHGHDKPRHSVSSGHYNPPKMLIKPRNH